MDTYLHRGLIYLCWITIIFNTVNCLTCGQTKCTDVEYCCSETEGQPKNCCCKSDATGFSRRCESSTSFSFPWWGAVLIVVAIIGIIAAIVFVIYRRKKRQTNEHSRF